MSPSPAPLRILVTGAAGFVGSRVVRQLLAHGCEVLALVRQAGRRERLPEPVQRLRVVQGDFHYPEAWRNEVAELCPSTLVHLAWHAEPEAYQTHAGNLDDLTASLRLFQQARTWGCDHFVGVGTCLEYDTRYGYLSEETPLAPVCLYASSKAALYLTASSWAHQSGASLAWARLFHQFGPGEDVRRLIPSVVTALLEGRPVAVTAGLQVRDYLHVDDVAAAIVQLALSDVGGPFNVGSGRPVRVRDLVALLESVVGRTGLVNYGARADPAHDPPFVCANSARLQTVTGWQASLTLEAGLAQTIAWWADQGPKPNKETLTL